MREKVAKQLYGRDFDIVKEGLDATQVEDLVTELVSERDTLLQRQEHLTSLTRLAERSVAEADALAKEIKGEAEEEAKKKASSILAKAEREAQELGERKKSEILDAANKEAQTIKENAQKEVNYLISQQQAQIQKELEQAVRNLHSRLLSELNGVTEQAASLQLEWQNKITETFANNPSIVKEPLSPATEEPEPSGEILHTAAKLEPVEATPPPATEEPVQNIQPEVAVPPLEDADNAKKATPAPELETTNEMPNPVADDADLSYRKDILAQIEQAWLNSESQNQATETGEAIDTAEKCEVSTLEAEKKPAKAYEGTVALDILPPLTPSQLVEIQKYLRAWPGIGITELSPHKNGYSITIVLQKPMQLIDILEELPEVAKAEEYTPKDSDELGSANDGKKRIAITVCSKK